MLSREKSMKGENSMWIRLTMANGEPVMVNMHKYGSFIPDMKTPSSGTILYQTDVRDDEGIDVKESFEEVERIVRRKSCDD